MPPPSRLQTPPMGPSATDANQPPGADAPSNARAIADILTRFVKYHPQRIDLSLDRMYRLLDDLDNPHATLPPVIHVAGTNGKGSTLAFLGAALTASGLHVSAYTSPHLVRFAERYRIAGEIIADADLLALFEEIDERNAGKPITGFEITTAAALSPDGQTAALPVGALTAPVFDRHGRVALNVGVHPFRELTAQQILHIGGQVARHAQAIGVAPPAPS